MNKEKIQNWLNEFLNDEIEIQPRKYQAGGLFIKTLPIKSSPNVNYILENNPQPRTLDLVDTPLRDIVPVMEVSPSIGISKLDHLENIPMQNVYPINKFQVPTWYTGNETRPDYSLIVKKFIPGQKQTKQVSNQTNQISTQQNKSSNTNTTQQSKQTIQSKSKPKAKINENDTYIIQSGDTLSDIALRVFGNASRWKEIADMNGIKGDKIYVGQKLTFIPKRKNLDIMQSNQNIYQGI